MLVANGAITAASLRTWYAALTPPPGNPPGWVFGPVWTTLYVLIGVAAWLVWRRIDVGAERKRAALRLWGWQLLLNALWPPAFFGLHNPPLAFFVLVALIAAVALTIKAFLRLRPLAGALLLPYAAWLCYAAYLNAGFWWLNRS